MSTVAIIPARGGSKRIPRKNIREFFGKPMIAWSIGTALESCLFDRVLVSTDDEEIAEIAKNCGAEVPFRRPENLADDLTATLPVIRHAVTWLEQNGEAVDAACCIYATAPFLQSKYLQKGFQLLSEQPGIDFAFSVTSFAFPIFRALTMDEKHKVAMIWPEQERVRSQDLKEAFHDAGQFYWGTTSAWKSRANIFSSSSFGIPLPRYCVQDIDTLEDWVQAELLFSTFFKGS